MNEDTKASAWRSRERCAGSVAVGAGVGAGEADGLGEAVGVSDCPDCSDCPSDCASSSVADADGVGLGLFVGWGPRGIRRGSTARVTPEVPARVRTAERSA